PGERREGVEVVLAEGVEVTGRVLDPDGLPVAGAGVQVLEVHGQRMAYRGEHATTGSDGRFTLDTLPEGRLTLRAHKEGFSPATEEIDLGPAGASAEIYLERGTEVRGRVLEADGSPGAGRTLRIAPHRSLLGSGARASAAADGSFAFRGVADGEYRLVVVEGHSVLWSSPEPVVVEGAPVSGLEIRLPSTATLQGRILGLDRSELRRVRVSGSSAGGGFHARRAGRVRRDGTYRIEGVTPGEWRITAESPLAGRQARGRVEIEEGQTIASLDLEFREGFTVRGVVERAGRSLPGATVQLSAQEYHGGRVTSDFEGRFRFQGVPRGEHRLTARDSQSGTALGRTVRVDGDRDLRLELEGYRLRGTVCAADGTGPVAEASVRLRRQEAPGDPPETSAMPSHTLTGRDGSFLLDGIAPGRWRLLVERAGYTAHAAEVEVAGGDVELAPVYLDRLPAEPR
ncbi:MAG: carboxypeptidase regulatory-like domain-containing protein, partial [Acidobacteriota bacterium]